MRMRGRRLSRIKLPGVALIVSVSILTFLAGCAKNYGRFVLDAEVSRDFRNGTIQTPYQYYYSGRDTMPYAIIGIDADYTVPSRYWIRFKPAPGQLKRMSENIYGKDQYNPYGAEILDHEGNVIGVWYSNVGIRSVSVDQTHHTVQVLFKNPENADGGDDDNAILP
jgi:hypothetical protein